jgi:hypothetical protein
MEQFFSPTRRLQDQLPTEESFEYEELDELEELELAVPVEEFLNHRWDWSDFRAFVMGGEMPTIVWIAEDSFLWVTDDHTSEIFRGVKHLSVKLTAANGAKDTLFLVKRSSHSSPSLLFGASSIFWHAVTTSQCVSLVLAGCSRGSFGLCSGPTLSHFLNASTWLRDLQFADIDFEEDYCRALATLERTDITIRFWYCALDAQDAEATFIEWLRHGQVVTELIGCTIKSSGILSALSGNSSVQSLSYDLDSLSLDNCEDHILRLAQAVPGNKGLVNLRLSWCTHHLMTNEMWNLICRSLWTHPRIESLSLSYDSCVGGLSAESITRRVHAVLQMVQCNTVVHTIYLPNTMTVLAIYQNNILPRLEMNRSCFEERRRSIKRSDPSIRGQLLGRALHVVRYNPNLIFRFLSENVPAFVRTEEEEEEDIPAVPLEQDPVLVSVSVSGQKRNAPS